MANSLNSASLQHLHAEAAVVVDLAAADLVVAVARGGGAAAAPTGPRFRLSGVSNGDLWTGVGEDTAGNKLTWSASLTTKGTADTT
jgi:hypothetical protein